MNRAERRAAMREAPRYKRMNKSDEAIVERMVRNGITAKDLEEEYRRGAKAGYQDGIQTTVKMVYAAVALAAHELYGFGNKRCGDLLVKMDDIVCNTLASDEAVEAVWEKIGLRMNFREAFDRVEEA